MKGKKRSLNRTLTIITTLIMVLMGVVFGMAFYDLHIKKHVTQKAICTLKSNALQEMRTTDIVIDAQYRMLEMYAELYTDQRMADNKNLWQIMGQMESVQRASDFFVVGISMPDGMAFTSSNVVVDVRDYSFFSTCMNGKRAIELMSGDNLDSGSHFCLAVPIISDGKVQGVVFGLCTEDVIRELIDPALLGNEGNSFLCDTNGDLLLGSDSGFFITTSADKTEIVRNVFKIPNGVVAKGSSEEKIYNDIKSGQTGTFEIMLDDKIYYGAYQPSGINDWVLFNIMNSEYVEQEVASNNRDMRKMLLIIMLFVVASAMFMLLVEHYNSKVLKKNQEQLRLSEEKAKLQKEKLEFALGRSSTRVWEYDILNKRITMDTQGLEDIYENVPDSTIEMALIYPDDIPRYIDLYNKVKDGEAYASTELRRIQADGRLIWEKLEYTTIFDENGKPIRAVGVSNDISAQKTAEKRYREEQAFRQIADPDTIISFCINCTTDTIEDVTSYDNRVDWLTHNDSFNEAVLMTAETIPNVKERENMKTELNTEAMLRHFADGITSYKVEYRRDLGGGDMRWLSCSVKLIRSPSSDNVMGFVYTRDINDQKILEMVSNSTVLADYEYVGCLDMNADYIYAAHIDKNINVIPKIEGECFSERLIRLSKGELKMTPKQIGDLSVASIKKRLEKENSYSLYFEAPTYDGKTVRKKVHYTYLNREDGLVLVTRSDVTDIYKEEQLKNEILMQALKAAENASRARGDFLAHMSHEIRTPLNGIRGMLDIIKANPDENLKLYLDKAIISAKHLTGLINDILDMSRIDSGKMVLNESWLSTAEFVEYIEAIIAPLAEEKGLEFVSQYNWDDCSCVFTDGSRLKQICINLLSNAVKYTNTGGRVEFCVSAKWNDGEIINFSVMVEDNGVGMTKEFLADAFEPFSQADSSFAKKGTGLGLAITKRLVELMNGRLSVESESDLGTKIGLELTMRGRRKQDSLKNHDSGLLHEYKRELSFSGKRALVVDDHKTNLLIAEKQLCTLEISVVKAYNGKEALEIFKSSPEGYYDIVFMDIMMPVKDGLTAARELRRLDRSDAKTVVIVAMTANAFAEDIHKSLENGMNYHLSKPFDREQLIGILRQAFKMN